MAHTRDYRLGEFIFPRGWFVVAAGSEIGEKPHCDRFFGEDVVLYRGTSGTVVMLDAYCPHMGTHLGKNKTSYSVVKGQHVEGDSIRCPFHGWRFGPDGKCNDIPYDHGAIPEKARVRSWHVMERYGIIFCWHDPEGGAPDVELPAYPEWDDARWVRWQLDHLGTLPVHPQEILDNVSDVRHLSLLHGSGVLWYENEVDGHILHQRQGGYALSGTEPSPLNRYSTDVRYVGPALLVSRYFTARSDEHFMVQMIAHTPVEDGLTRLWQASMLKSPKEVIDEEVRETARRSNEQLKEGFMEDFEIWANKKPALDIMQLPTDGPFGKSRIWYRQFYSPRARAHEIIARVLGVHGVKGCPTRAQYLERPPAPP